MSSTGTAPSVPSPVAGVAPPRTGAPPVPTRRGTAPLTAAAVACAVVGVVLRWWPRGPLWLDEAQSVSFARLGVRSIPHALRQDGAPPGYYLLLHAWMVVFGDSSGAVRALSATVSTLTLVVLG